MVKKIQYIIGACLCGIVLSGCQQIESVSMDDSLARTASASVSDEVQSIETKYGTAYFIHSEGVSALINGNEKAPVEQVLKEAGIAEVDYAILTETTVFQIGEFSEVLLGTPAKVTVVPKQNTQDRSYQNFKSAAQSGGRDVIQVSESMEFNIGTQMLSVQHNGVGLDVAVNGVRLQ